MPGKNVANRKSGFTLIEILAALAIGSVVIFGCATLLHNIVFSFDRGTNRVTNGERVALAAERLDTDIGAARFVLQNASNGAVVAFNGQPSAIVFVSTAGFDPGLQKGRKQPGAGEVIKLSILTDGDATQIVRSRAAWPGPRTSLESVSLGGQVVLLKGDFDAAFKFGAATANGALTWTDTWVAQQSLPHLVKLNLRDRVSGLDLLGGAVFVIHADAAPACAHADASLSCLSRSSGDSPQAASVSSQPVRSAVP